MKSRLKALAQSLREVQAQRERIADLEREIMRLSPQVAALEQRVEDLQQRLDTGSFSATPEERSDARKLVDEVRAEHAKVRARITAATVFEERLRVVEERLKLDSATGRSAQP